MAERAARSGWMIAVGVVLVVGTVGAAIALWVAAGQRQADNVAGFARAPVGCETTLDFDATGTFVIYIETTGEFEELAGACDADLRYDRDPDDVPDPELILVDPDGDDVAFGDTDDRSYDVDGFVGTASRSVEIETTGDHVLTVAPTTGDSFAVAIGRTPDDGVALLRWGAIAAAIVGLLVGGLLLVLGSRRPPAAPVPTQPWTPDGRGWPASPPGFPVPPPTTGASGPAGPPPPDTPPVPPPAVDDRPPSPWAPPAPPR